MKTAFLTLLATLVLAGCGGSPCEHYIAASDRFFDGKTECAYNDGSSTITLSRKRVTCTDLSACSDSDLTALDSYASCLEKTTACTTGAEQQATSGGLGCAFSLAGSVSSACATALQ